ncbi:hypothetical protein [Flaviflagellibacter deserti]|uniref:Uncharacterized protein n=1 Tax=Flaviflagellibacter deserti TaxID=2267266 RepID=A0ABV9Z7P5_9HYPH
MPDIAADEGRDGSSDRLQLVADGYQDLKLLSIATMLEKTGTA